MGKTDTQLVEWGHGVYIGKDKIIQEGGRETSSKGEKIEGEWKVARLGPWRRFGLGVKREGERDFWGQLLFLW